MPGSNRVTDGAKQGMGRRKFLTFVVAAPTLTMAGWHAISEADPLRVPQPGDLMDLGDFLNLASQPTHHLMRLEITEAGLVQFEVPRAEVGQGITTAMAMILADELDARMGDVDVRISDARQEFQYNQFTGASTGVRNLWDPVRKMAAEARARLVTAAADKWGLSPDDLTTKDTAVWAPDGRSASYGSLSKAAAKTTPRASTTPKDPENYQVIGTSVSRQDAVNIVTGKALYAMDLQIEGALPTVVARPPTINGKVARYDDAKAASMPGVVAVTEIPTGVAVTAKSFYEALAARDALEITWRGGPVDGVSDADVRAKLAEAMHPLASPAPSAAKVDATFDYAFVNHAPMEVQCAVADVRADHAKVWMPSQTPMEAQRVIAGQLGLSTGKVAIHTVRAGGSFGRRMFFDAGVEAALVSQQIGKPVKLMWTRSDDMKHGRMRPASHHKIRATYLAGNVLSFEHRTTAVELDLKHGLGDMLTASGAKLPGGTLAQMYFMSSETVPYKVGLATQTLTEVPLQVPTASLRSVYSGSVRVSEEIVMDELAKRFGKDPVQFRRDVIDGERGRAVLDKVAEAGNWGKRMRSGRAQGVGYHAEYRSHVAALVELDARDKQAPRVTKAVIAVDVGRAVNPRGLEAQMMGGMMDAIAMVLQAGVHIDDGAVRESSFADYRWTKHRHAPAKFEVHIMPPTGAKPGGAGELAVPAVAGAVANAYARATGSQPRSFPINF
jgi:isoquinoline 1-oxidoreductase beta subunit